ncbi:MAG: DUF4926 domain-containing protein [Candidatus Kapaibacterium sp.]
MIKELSLVVLTRSIPEHALVSGDVGTVVHVYPNGEAYEVEFMTGLGKTVAVLTLRPVDVRPIAAEILHARSIGQAARV